MPVLTVILEGDGSMKEAIQGKEVYHVGNEDDPPIIIAALSKGMTSGRASIAFGIDIGDNKYVIAETSMRLFLGAARAFAARFGDEI